MTDIIIIICLIVGFTILWTILSTVAVILIKLGYISEESMPEDPYVHMVLSWVVLLGEILLCYLP